ncbi:hypothetical protein NFI96_027345, partial [Prochilodus magdalenae]
FSSGAVSYSREALLEFGKVHHELTFSLSDFDFLLRSDTADTSQQGPAAPASGRRRSGRTECPRRKRGKRGGLHARLKARAMRPPLPSLLLANVRSLENKLDELRARITTQREIRDCCALILTETWLSDSTPDSAIQLQTHSVHRGDRTAASGKNKGGGVCVFVNNRWCSDIKTVEKTLFNRSRTADGEVQTLLPAERVQRCVYSGCLHSATRELGDGAGAAARRNQQARDRTPGRAVFILLRLGRTSDGPTHISVFLYPAYRQLLKQAPPVSKTIKVWTEETDLVLQDCFDTTDWEVFRTAAVGEDCTVDLEDYASGVTSYISTCIETIVPTKRCRTYPNQKPWINCDVRSMLRARSTAFLSGNAEDYKRARYDLRRSIRQAKRQYRVKLEGCYTSADSRRMWQGLRHITDYQQRSREVTTSHTTLPDQLNEFYARFEALNPDRQRGVMAEGSTQNSSLTVTSVEVCKALRRINPRKAAGPDNIPGRALKVCSSELAGVFLWTYSTCPLHNLLCHLASRPPPSSPSLRKSVVTCLNDYRPVALTPIVMKCFERIVMSHIQETIPDNLDPLQFAYRQNRSTDDAVNTAIHTALTHLEGKDTYVRMLFIDYRSAFNTVIPTKLAGKLLTLGLTPTLCNWVLNFLTDRPQSVRIGSRTSSTRTSNTSIIKFADDTTVIGLITGGDETAYRREVAELVDWCDYNNLSLNTDKTKEMIVDPRRRRRELHTPLFIGGTEVERVKTFKFLRRSHQRGSNLVTQHALHCP